MQFLVRANDTSEWMWRIYFRVMPVVLVMNFAVAPVISILVNWFANKNFEVENFFHPTPLVYVKIQLKIGSPIHHEIIYFSFKYSLPWNQTTFMGYVGELALSIPAGFGYWFVNGTFLLLFISICTHHQAFCEMLGHSVEKLNRSDGDENSQCIAKSFRDFIRFHLSVKE